MAILTLDKVVFKITNTKQNRKRPYNKGRLYEKNIISINLYSPNNTTAKRIKQKWLGMQRECCKSVIVVEDLRNKLLFKEISTHT